MAVASSARLAFLRGAVCACCTLRQTLSPFWVPLKTQGRTLDCPFNFRPPRVVAGWFFLFCVAGTLWLDEGV